MDSGHSDSSSCGEDQEFDSRAAAAYYSSSFVNHQVPPLPPPFDPFANFLQLQNPSALNTNVFWPRNTDLSSDLCHSNNIINFPFTAPTQPTTLVSSGNNLNEAPPASAAENGTLNRNPAARNTKKRSRASRRAPTTVLTTDTSNFRAMVQEFTGIPAPPFTSSSPFQRSRLDLFGASSSMRLKPHDAAQPPYLHRPFAPEMQRQPPPQLFLTSTASISSSSTTNSVASTSTPPMNYRSLSTPNSSVFNLISNPNLTPFLPTDHKFPFLSSILPSKIQGPFEIPTDHGLHSNVKTVGFDELSARRANVSATIGNLPNLISSDPVQPRNDHNNDNNAADGLDHVRAESRNNLNGIQSLSRNISRNERMNYLQNPSTDFHGEKGQENIGTRSSEGMMESWICSSE
ncbi:VQ motif-containing protein [Dorcoceras hygrometricum]|uniref:VQ motif-containing protein n=1 Tax=Dorcoceras hygrometricum TaxID=472368 RepID=A0A2Z7CRP1_9LAMI|nr:VQ motif-containing protein [Dorcoceras hygrometricum]